MHNKKIKIIKSIRIIRKNIYNTNSINEKKIQDGKRYERQKT